MHARALHRRAKRFTACFRFSPSGDFFVSVSNDMKGLIFDGKTGDKIGELNQDKASKHSGSIYSCCFSADRSLLHKGNRMQKKCNTRPQQHQARHGERGQDRQSVGYPQRRPDR